MKKGKRVYKSIMAILGAVALFFLGLVVISYAWDLVGTHRTMIIVGIAGILFFLIIFRVLTLKQIKRKVIDIFT